MSATEEELVRAALIYPDIAAAMMPPEAAGRLTDMVFSDRRPRKIRLIGQTLCERRSQ